MSDIQATLERLFSPPLDGSLVAAIAHEPDQTLQSAKEVCEMLARDTDPTFELLPLEEELDDGVQTSTKPTPRSLSPPRQAGRRKAFGAKLTTDRPRDQAPSSSSAPSASSSGSSTPSGSSPPTSDEGSIERLLDEWKLIDSSSADPDNLRLTDDEGQQAEGEEQPISEIEEKLTREMNLLEQEVGDGHLDPAKVASGEEGVVGGSQGLTEETLRAVSQEGTSTNQDAGLLFLIHAFPSRTPGFIEETLSDCRGDVQVAIDTLMVLDMVESEEVRGQQLASPAMTMGTEGETGKKGLDYDKLENGFTMAKGKKRRAERKRMQMEQLQAMGLAPGETAPSSNGAVPGSSKGKANSTVVSLTDVRHGASVKANNLRGLKAAQQARSGNAAGSTSTSRTPTLISTGNGKAQDDEALATQLADEERRQAGEPGVDQPVTDNAWLLSSSVLSQLCTLLEVPQNEAQSTYVQSSFNLHVASARIVDKAADRWPTLSSLDEAGKPPAPPGTAATMASGISALTGKSLAEAETALRATMGRQDAAIDLLQLLDVIKAAAPGEAPDALDPLGRLRDGSVPTPPPSSALRQDAQGFSVAAGPSGRNGKVEEFPLPSDGAKGGWTTVVSRSSSSSSSSSGGYAAAVDAPRPNRPYGPAAAISSGSATYTTLPASASAMPTVDESIRATRCTQGLGTHQASFDPARRAAECRMIADDYRAKRDENLRKASAAYRTSGLRAAVPRSRNGRQIGAGDGAAWYYAEEARRLDAKSRAWSLRAAQALVEDRRSASLGVVGGVRGGGVSGVGSGSAGVGSSSTTGRKGASVIDLHGVTVHEALTITRDVLNEWWATPSHRSSGALQIITGVGRHSPHQIAVLKPAVMRMLEREGWRAEVDHHRGIITVRGLAS